MLSSVRQQLAATPDLVRLAALNPARYPCLLHSAARGGPRARWDILPAFPQTVLQRDADGGVRLDGRLLDGDGFLATLDHCWQAHRCQRHEDELPFHGGWALYLGYELVGEIEPGLALPAGPPGQPQAMALRCPAAVLIDHERHQAWVVAEPGHAPLVDRICADIERAQHVAVPPLPAPRAVREDPDRDFLNAVVRARKYIAAGDVFQVNLSRQWRARFDTPVAAASVHQALCRANPAPFAVLWQQPGWAVVSSSPERLVEVRGARVQTRPIAGTRPRAAGDDDSVLSAELMAHPKERAEHIMLIDLERNDLGRLCRPGSVEVNELMVLESHPHVHHIVSNVRGELYASTTPGQVIAACFPGGTITGCPKVRCMQIIAELEGRARGAYTGALGYLDSSGDMDLNILIRSFTQRGDGLSLRAGAGIVHDSVPEHELDETRAKARGLLQALEPA